MHKIYILYFQGGQKTRTAIFAVLSDALRKILLITAKCANFSHVTCKVYKFHIN